MNILKKMNFGKNKKKKYKLNKTVFQSFLLSASVLFILFSLMYEKSGKVINLFIALCFSVFLPMYSAIKKIIKKKDYLSLDLVVSVSAIYLFFFKSYFEALASVILYVLVSQIFKADFFFKPATFKVFKNISEKKYHCIYDRESFYRDAKKIEVGDNIELFSGETIPVDGIVKAGSGTVSTANITGDSKVKTYKTNDVVYAGYILLGGNIIIEAKSTVETSVMKTEGDNILKLSESRTKGENISYGILRIVSLAILVLSLVFTIVSYVKTQNINFIKFGIPLILIASSTEISKLAISDSYKASLFHAMKKAIMINDKSLIENSLNTTEMYFDIVGVLTNYKPSVVDVSPIFGITEKELVKFAAYSLYRSDSPLAKAILKYNDEKILSSEIVEFEPLSSGGGYVKVKNDIEIITATSGELKKRGIISGLDDDVGIMCVAINDNFAGYIKLDYPVREDIRLCVDSLRFAGIKKLSVISQNTGSFVNDIASKAGIENVITSDNFDKEKEKISPSAVLFSNGTGSYENDFNSIRFGFTDDKVQAFTVVDSLTPAISFANIVKDCKILMVQNCALSIVAKIILISILFAAESFLGAVAIAIIGKLLCKLNCVRMMNKI